MKRRDLTLILCIAYSVLLVLFDFFKFDWIIKIKVSQSFGAEILLGFILYIPYIIFACLTGWSIIYIFKKIKSKKWKSILPTAVMAFTILLLIVFPYTKTYINMFYKLNQEQLQKTIQMVNSEEIHSYAIDENEYRAPFRLTSYSGVMHKDSHNGVTKVKFYAFKGIKKDNDVIIVYSSDDSSIDSDDFSDDLVKWNLSNIKKICPNWYSATVNGYELNSNYYPMTESP